MTKSFNDKEKARLISLLCGDQGAHVREIPGKEIGFDQGEVKYGAFANASGLSLPSMRVETLILQKLLSDGVLQSSGKRFLVTEAGRFWLRRYQLTAKGEETFQNQHREAVDLSVTEADGVTDHRRANAAESPLNWLYMRKGVNGKPLIDIVQFRAGLRLHKDYLTAGMESTASISWNPNQSQSARKDRGQRREETSDIRLDAQHRMRTALDAIGPELGGAVFDVCCLERSLGDVEARYGWPRRSAKVVIDLGLKGLARHYGMIGETGRSAAKTRHWGSTDYRPPMEAP